MAKDKTYPVEPAVVEQMLQKLATDDAFREKFTKNWRSAIETLGHKPPKPPQPTPPPPGKPTPPTPEPIPPECEQPQQIASKEVIAKSLDALRSTLASGLTMNVKVLDDRAQEWGGKKR